MFFYRGQRFLKSTREDGVYHDTKSSVAAGVIEDINQLTYEVRY